MTTPDQGPGFRLFGQWIGPHWTPPQAFRWGRLRGRVEGAVVGAALTGLVSGITYAASSITPDEPPETGPYVNVLTLTPGEMPSHPKAGWRVGVTDEGEVDVVADEDDPGIKASYVASLDPPPAVPTVDENETTVVSGQRRRAVIISPASVGVDDPASCALVSNEFTVDWTGPQPLFSGVKKAELTGPELDLVLSLVPGGAGLRPCE